MTSPRPERRTRRFQFGLRRLLLWTAVVAVLLGVAASLGDGAWLLACCVLVVCVLRVAFGSKVAGILSVAAALILYVSFSLLAYMATSNPNPVLAGVVVIMRGAIGGLVGLAMFGIAEGAVRGVNWADKLLETTSDGETRRD